MPELGNVKTDDLYPKVVLTLNGMFWIIMCYEKNGLDYLHNCTSQETHHTAEQAIKNSQWELSPEKVINNFA